MRSHHSAFSDLAPPALEAGSDEACPMSFCPRVSARALPTPVLGDLPTALADALWTSAPHIPAVKACIDLVDAPTPSDAGETDADGEAPPPAAAPRTLAVIEGLSLHEQAPGEPLSAPISETRDNRHAFLRRLLADRLANSDAAARDALVPPSDDTDRDPHAPSGRYRLAQLLALTSVLAAMALGVAIQQGPGWMTRIVERVISSGSTAAAASTSSSADTSALGSVTAISPAGSVAANPADTP